MDVAKMIVSVGADTRGATAGFNKAAQDAQKFADRVEKEFAGVGASAQGAFANLIPADISASAQKLGLSVRDPLVKIMAETADLIEGELDRAFSQEGELARLGKEGGAAFTHALESEISRIAASPAIKGALARAMSELNMTPRSLAIAQSFRDAEASANRLAVSVGKANSTLGALGAQAQRLTAHQNRLANASISVAFALEGVFEGGNKADAGVRQALRAIATLGPAFGPTGLLVSGVAASTNAIVGLFTRTRDELRQTALTFNEEIGKLLRNADVLGLQRAMQDIELGDPTKGVSKFAEGFTEGLNDLMARKNVLEQSLRGLAPLSRPAKEIQKILTATQRAIDPLIAKYVKLLEAHDAVFAIKDPKFSPTLTIKTNIPEVLTELERLKKHSDVLLQAQAQIASGAFPAIVGLPQGIAALYEEAITAAKRFDGVASAQANALRAMVAELKASGEAAKRVVAEVEAARKRFGGLTLAIPAVPLQNLIPAGAKIQLPTGLIPPTTEEIFGLTQAVQRVVDARGLLDLSKLTGDKDFIKQVEQQLRGAEQRFQAFAASVALALSDPSIPADQLRAKIEALQTALAKAGAGPVNKLAEGLQLAVQAGRGLLGVADGIGKIGTRARQSIDGVLNLTDSLVKLGEATAMSARLASGIGAIGGAIQIGAGLFGESETEKEANRLRKENNDVIRRLSEDLRGFGNSLGNQQRVAGAIIDPRVQLTFAAAPLNKDFERELARFGLTLADINRIAKDNGIQLLNDQGKRVAGALGQLEDALRLQIQLLTTFGESLDEQRLKLSLRNEVFDIDQTPAQRFNDALALLATQSHALSGAFAGIDVTTNAGRLAAEDVLREFVRRLEAGSISALEFEKFAGKDAFIQWILDADHALDDLTSAINKAAGAMLNVPKVLKVATLAFQAQRTSNPLPESIVSEPGWMASRSPVTFNVESIVVQAGDGDSKEIARNVVSELQSVARARFGDSRRWFEVN